jgi:transcriptional regulator with XRE-family HTH domain
MDSEEDKGVASAQQGAHAGAGMQLRAAREALGLDLAQIAAETRIPLRHLEAIEAGNFAALPSRTYAIGFSRSFAKAVGLDEAAILAAVRAELAEAQARRSAASGGMEPGDPAKLPSAGLAWFAAFAALVLGAGLVAFFTARFGAGVSLAPLTAPPSPAPPSLAPGTAALSPTAAAPAPAAADGPVVLTAIEDVWLRIYEEGGERLIEKQLKKGESVTIPATAADPRLNTGRPDLLAITVGGRAVPPLSDRPETLARVPVSAAALLARAAPAAAASGAPGGAASAAPLQTATAAAPLPVRRRPPPPPRPAASETPAPAAPPEPAPADEG